MRRCATPSHPHTDRTLIALALVALLALASGCVTRGKYREAVDERDALRATRVKLEREVQQLKASTRSLGGERARLMDELEDLRQQREALDADLRKLRKSEDLLTEHLRVREAALAEASAEVRALRSTYTSLVEDLESEVASGRIEIEQLREGVRLNMKQDILFPSGSARLNPEGRTLLRKVSARLKDVPHTVEVQGHTDNVPISSALAARFPSNWELAAARATEVVRVLAEAGVSQQRLTAVSFGEHQPVASNKTAQGRAKNRRIEIRLSPPPDAAPARAATAR